MRTPLAGLQRKNSYSSPSNDQDEEKSTDVDTESKRTTTVSGTVQRTHPRRRHSWGSPDLIIAASSNSQSNVGEGPGVETEHTSERGPDTQAGHNSTNNSIDNTEFRGDDLVQAARRGAAGSTSGNNSSRRHRN